MSEKKDTDWMPVRRPVYRTLTFLPNLFRVPPDRYPPFSKNDPFIHPEVLKETCSVSVPPSDGKRVPRFVDGNKDIEDTISFTEEDWNDICQSQIGWENRELSREKKERETLELANQEKKEKEAADTQIKQTLDRKVDRIFNRHYHFIKKTCPVMIPYKSSLNHEEHKAYLRAFVKFRFRPPVTASESLEYENYLRLQNRVYEEQQNFMGFAYKVARIQLKLYNEVPDVISNYVSDYVKERCKQVLNYKQFYTPEQSIPICPLDPTNRYNDLYFKHVGHLLSIGNVPRITLPNPHTLCQIPIDDTVKKKEPVLLPDEEGKYLHKIPVSKDPNAIYLARKHGANIVASASALKVIAENPGPHFDKEWDIPVVVRSYTITDSDGNEKQQRVAFIDKPMPKKIWTPSEKKQFFFQKSAVASMTDIARQNFFRMKCPMIFKVEKVGPAMLDIAKEDKHDKQAAEYDEDFLDLYSAADHDVFGVSVPVATFENDAKSTKKRKLEPSGIDEDDKGNDNFSTSNEKIGETNSTKNKIVVNDSCKVTLTCEKANDGENKPITEYVSAPQSEGTSCMLDDLLSMQDSLHKSSLSESPLKTDDTATRIRKLWPWSQSLRTDWEDHVEAKNCKSFSGVNVHYQLYSMGFDNTKPFSSSQPINVIVRSHLHGLSWYQARKGKSKAYVVHAKPEFQVYFGCEINTLSEITRQWLDLLVRPNTSLLEVRVCQTTGDIMLSEEKTLESVLKDGKQQHINFSPQQPLASMHAIFNAVSALPTGDYLLHHDIKTEAFIKLLKATDIEKEASYQTYDFHSAYSSVSVYTRTHAKPPWIALDTHKLTAFHLKHYKIPGTFPMDNPSKKLTRREKKKIKEKAKKKKRIDDTEGSGGEQSD